MASSSPGSAVFLPALALCALAAACGGGAPFEEPPESVVVDVVAALSDPVDQIVTVGLVHSRDVSLEMGTARADLYHDMLSHSLQYQRPDYLELEPATRRILEIELPYVSPVAALQETADGVEVTLIYSAAIHFLYRTNDHYQEFFDLLSAALASGASLVVTERDQVGIIDVRADTFTTL